MALLRMLLSVVVIALLMCLAAVQARYLPTRADETNMRAVKHMLSQVRDKHASRQTHAIAGERQTCQPSNTCYLR